MTSKYSYLKFLKYNIWKKDQNFKKKKKKMKKIVKIWENMYKIFQNNDNGYYIKNLTINEIYKKLSSSTKQTIILIPKPWGPPLSLL